MPWIRMNAASKEDDKKKKQCKRYFSLIFQWIILVQVRGVQKTFFFSPAIDAHFIDGVHLPLKPHQSLHQIDLYSMWRRCYFSGNDFLHGIDVRSLNILIGWPLAIYHTATMQSYTYTDRLCDFLRLLLSTSNARKWKKYKLHSISWMINLS